MISTSIEMVELQVKLRVRSNEPNRRPLDALNGQLMLDNYTSEKMSRMDPHLGVMDLNRPFRVSRHIALPTPVLSTINAWICEGDDISQPAEV